MKEMTYNEKRRAELMSYLEKIKSFGYKVRVSNSMYYHYAYIIDKHNVVGYCELNEYGGVDLGTMHHPNYECGTGFTVAKMLPIDQLTPSIVERCFCIAPCGFTCYSSFVKKVIIDDKSSESKRIIDWSNEI